jgi:transcriptional regulator with XRE-family HTH domain
VDVSLVIRQRLSELRLDQRDLASAAQVTESYISQLLTRKKAPPAPARTDIYDKIGEFLALPSGELSKLAEVQRQQELKKKVTETPQPLFTEFRELILRKCAAATHKEVRRIFEKEAFGELERLVTQKLLDVAQGVAKDELRSEEWLHLLAQMGGRNYEEMRVAILEFLDADVFDVSLDNCVSFLDPMVESWDIDLKTFSLEIILNRRLAPGAVKRFEFLEKEPDRPAVLEPGFEKFLRDSTLSGDITEEEIEFLKKLKFYGRKPAAIYYYRELQSLRDPLHFSPTEQKMEFA